MALTHPALQEAYERFQSRRSGRKVFANQQASEVGHAPLKTAYVRDYNGYLTVRYCPACQRGFVHDLVRDIPDGTPRVSEAGVTVMREWKLECQQ